MHNFKLHNVLDGKTDFPWAVRNLPDRCPVCKQAGQPTFLAGVKTERTGYLTFVCPLTKCRAVYVARYQPQVISPQGYVTDSSLETALPAVYTQPLEFPGNVKDMSPNFCLIYEQAHVAEASGLDQICGPGYRKSLEFLIKDFITNHVFKGDAVKTEEVKKAFLAPVIRDHIDDPRIKAVAQRATWLGNDETHYVRKWVDKDINDLKGLIRITSNFVDSVIEADRHLAEMPDPSGPPTSTNSAATSPKSKT